MIRSEIPYIALVAALYALGKLATAFIPTPWGTGQLLIFIIIPVFFAFYLRPISIGLAAALGTFIGDAFFLTPFGLTNPLLSLIAGVPANFVGFYLIGWWFRRFKGWNGFALGTFISLFVGNFIAAAGVVAYLSIFIPSQAALATGAKLALLLGFTLFWLGTMYPLILIINPPMIRLIHPYISTKLRSLSPPEWVLARPSFGLPLIAISMVFIALFGLLQFTGLGEALAIASPTGTKDALAYLSLTCSAVSFLTWAFYSLFQR